MGFLDRLLGKKEQTYTQKPAMPDINSVLEPGVGRIPFPAYRGNEPYIFISYAHNDAELVFAEIKRFYDQGYHVWYDEGIAPGNEWPEDIAHALSGCQLFVFMATPCSIDRINVRNEINFALEEDKNFIAIHLKPTKLTGGLRLQIGSKQAILKYTMTENEYIYKYTSAFERCGIPIPDKLKRTTLDQNMERPVSVKKEEASQKKQAMYTPEPPAVAKPEKEPKAVIDVSENGMLLPKGTAVITLENGDTCKAVANSMISRVGGVYETICDGLLMNGKPIVRYRELKSLRITSVGSWKKQALCEWLNGKKTEEEFTSEEFCFLAGNVQITLTVSEVASIQFDWEQDLITEWPGFLRFHLLDGSTVVYPEALAAFATMKTPDKKTFSTTETPHWTSFLELEHGRRVSLTQIGSIAFGIQWLPEKRIDKRWYHRLAASMVLTDGTRLQNDIQAGVLQFFVQNDQEARKIMAEEIVRIDRVSQPYERVEEAETPKLSKEENPVLEKLQFVPELPETPHICGDYTPQGTACIRTVDGKTHTAAANSLVYYAKGVALDERCLYSKIVEPDSPCEKFISFSDMEQVSQIDGRLHILNSEEETAVFSIAEDARLWFLSPEDTLEPSKIDVETIDSISFDRDHTPDMKVRYCKITTMEGSYRSPAPFLWMCEKNGEDGYSLIKDFTKYAGSPLTLKRLHKLVVTENASLSNPYRNAHDMSVTAILKNQDAFEFSIDKDVVFSSMAAHGNLVEPTCFNLLCIETVGKAFPFEGSPAAPGGVSLQEPALIQREYGVISPKGTVTITLRSGISYTSVAGSLVNRSSFYDSVSDGMDTGRRWGRPTGYLKFSEVCGIYMDKEAENDILKAEIHYRNGGKVQEEIYVVDFGERLEFGHDKERTSVNTKQVQSIRFDWEQELITEWPGFARFHRKDGAAFVYPEFLVYIKVVYEPDPDIGSIVESVTQSLELMDGRKIPLAEIGSIAFDVRWNPKKICGKQWFYILAASMVLKDGTKLQGDINAGRMSFLAVDSLGTMEIPVEELARIDMPSSPCGNVEVAKAPVIREWSSLFGKFKSLPEFPTNQHVYGNYDPKGTAWITTTEGTCYTAIANSLVFYAKGIDSDEFCFYSGIDGPGSQCGSFLYFSEMMQAEKKGSRLGVTDFDEETTDFAIAKGSQLWFIESHDATETTILPMEAVASIHFDRAKTPDVPLTYFRITTRDGVFCSPAPFLRFLVKDGGKRYRFIKNLSKYAGAPLPLRWIRKFVDTKQPSVGEDISLPHHTRVITVLKNEAVFDFCLWSDFEIVTLGAHGKVVRSAGLELLSIEAAEK